MSNIFISYAKEDRESARKLARVLEAEGWEVFWDRNIPTGKTWRDIIETKLKAAQCLVVLWSKASISSYWVLEEADKGRQRPSVPRLQMSKLKKNESGAHWKRLRQNLGK